MPVVKCEVISHDLEYEERTTKDNDTLRFNNHTLVVKPLGVSFRPYWYISYLITLLLFIPYIFDDLYQCYKRDFHISLFPPEFGVSPFARPPPKEYLLGPCCPEKGTSECCDFLYRITRYIRFIPLYVSSHLFLSSVVFRYLCDLISVLLYAIFGRLCKWKVFTYHSTMVGTNLAAGYDNMSYGGDLHMGFNFENGEACLVGSECIKAIKINQNPGKQMEIAFSPVFFWCFFKPKE